MRRAIRTSADKVIEDLAYVKSLWMATYVLIRFAEMGDESGPPSRERLVNRITGPQHIE